MALPVHNELKKNPQYALHIDGLVQERCNSIANALELGISMG